MARAPAAARASEARAKLRGCCSNCAQYASWIAGRYAACRYIFGHNTAGADGTVVTNTNSRKNYYVGANPHVISDHNRRGRRRRVTLFEAMLVPIHDPQVMT